MKWMHIAAMKLANPNILTHKENQFYLVNSNYIKAEKSWTVFMWNFLPRIKWAPFHPYNSNIYLEKGARLNVPSPEPHTDIPMAIALFFSKYWLTAIIHCRYNALNAQPISNMGAFLAVNLICKGLINI